jgi:hypothetical protein
MSKIMLKLQDLTTGNTSVREFDDEAATLAFLRERPRFTDVLGVVFEGLSKEQNARLRAAMRPLDDEEIAAETKIAEAAEKAAEAERAKRAKDAEAAKAAHREALKTADPDRPMEVRYRFGAGLSLVDPEDPRPINQEVEKALLEWVAERNEWVHDRGQIVGEAKVVLRPGALKAGQSRVVSGSFIPVTAPDEKVS